MPLLEYNAATANSKQKAITMTTRLAIVELSDDDHAPKNTVGIVETDVSAHDWIEASGGEIIYSVPEVVDRLQVAKRTVRLYSNEAGFEPLPYFPGQRLRHFTGAMMDRLRTIRDERHARKIIPDDPEAAARKRHQTA